MRKLQLRGSTMPGLFIKSDPFKTDNFYYLNFSFFRIDEGSDVAETSSVSRQFNNDPLVNLAGYFGWGLIAGFGDYILRYSQSQIYRYIQERMKCRLEIYSKVDNSCSALHMKKAVQMSSASKGGLR